MLAVLLTCTYALAGAGTTLYSFSGPDGSDPLLGLVFDNAGNLYGVTYQGGAYNGGTVFELMPGTDGKWNLKTLYSFVGGADGDSPFGPVILDASGNLYGTTKLGGANGTGTAFELIRSESGGWTKKVLHNFGGGGDGQFPSGNLIFDSAGNLYGTTSGGGAYGNSTEFGGGTAYELAQSGGAWTETVIHSFGSGKDGAVPRGAGLVLDNAGNLYGTTTTGGNCLFRGDCTGTVFQLVKRGEIWDETTIHNFDPNLEYGSYPDAGLIFDSAGNLYGTTVRGYGGEVFELSPQAGGGWTETVLANLYDGLSSGEEPYSGLVFDAAGNLYSAAIIGAGPYGNNDASGTVFELSPEGGGFWSEFDVYTFNGLIGGNPGIGALVLDASGNLYGAVQNGGAHNNGAIFEYTP
jgi:uncharacterized repeat protein (TIGR03803 family)